MEDQIKEIISDLKGGTLIDAQAIKPHMNKSITNTSIRATLVRMGLFMKRVKGRRVKKG